MTLLQLCQNYMSLCVRIGKMKVAQVLFAVAPHSLLPDIIEIANHRSTIKTLTTGIRQPINYWRETPHHLRAA